MLSKVFGSLDLGKFSLGTVPGFITGVAVLLLVDAFTPGHLTANLLNEKPTGTLVIEAIIVILGSAVLGTLVDNVFHTFGRWFAGKIWMKLHRAFNYRNCLMENLGLAKEEFEWVQSKDKDKSSQIETNYMRYTEVAGSTTYATWFLAIAMGVFVRYEQDQSWWLALLVAAIIGIIAIIFLLTSAASLAKYEMNKTMSAMDEIRSMSSHNCPIGTDGEKVICWGWLRKGALWLIPLFFGTILAITGCLVCSPVANHITPTNGIEIISKLGSDNSIPTLELDITDGMYQYASSMIINLNGVFHDLKLVGSDDNNIVDLVHDNAINIPNKPEWTLNATLGPTTVSSNNTVSLNVFFDAKIMPKPGNWLFPVLVTESSKTNKTYLLAYIRVTISPVSGIETTTTSTSEKETAIQTISFTPLATTTMTTDTTLTTNKIKLLYQEKIS